MLWIASRYDLTSFDGQAFTTFTPRDDIRVEVDHAIHQDKDGSIWFGTGVVVIIGEDRDASSNAGVFRYDSSSFTQFIPRDGLVHHDANAITHDADGTLWLGTYTGGLSRYDGTGFTS